MKIVIKDTESVRKDILKRGMNMRQFAERVDITQHYWSNIMNGKRYPSAAVALLGIAVYAIIKWWRNR